VLVREAWFQGAWLFVEGLDALDPGGPAWSALAAALAEHAGVVVLAGARAWPSADEGSTGLPAGPLGVLTVPFGPPDAPARAGWWRGALASQGAALPENDLVTLSERFRIGPEAIAEAAAVGALRARLRAAEGGGGPDQGRDAGPAPTLADLSAAARAQTGRALVALALRVEPRAGWDDLVVPDDTLEQLREICRRAEGRRRVMTEWGFGRKLSRGRGVNALFAGPAGVGKTLAAEVVAGELALDLFVIDLAGVVSKYIGETEKNLDRVFRAAEGADAVLFFDEADALFGKRSEVRDSHDRYANIEISYLLQKVELYDGVAVLATNLRQHLDEAFTRRLAFTVSFPFPEEADRRRIWRGVWPRETPLGDLDLDALAGRFKLSGGQIKNIALAAAHLAAADGGVVTMGHLLHATRREYQKLGKVLTDAELAGAPTGGGDR
jgi:hypothetical protein